MQLLPLVLLLGVMYFLLIRPQQQRVKAQKALVLSLGVGDEIVTMGGVLGRILALDDETITLESTPGTVLRIRRGAVATRVGPEPLDGGIDDPLIDEG
jgi:preprotein translocase subunit YajC